VSLFHVIRFLRRNCLISMDYLPDNSSDITSSPPVDTMFVIVDLNSLFHIFSTHLYTKFYILSCSVSYIFFVPTKIYPRQPCSYSRFYKKYHLNECFIFLQKPLSFPFLGFKLSSRSRLISSRFGHVVIAHCRKLECAA
jgi:hypothetical protein